MPAGGRCPLEAIGGGALSAYLFLSQGFCPRPPAPSRPFLLLPLLGARSRGCQALAGALAPLHAHHSALGGTAWEGPSVIPLSTEPWGRA